MDTGSKLTLLADSARYDLSCACGTKDKAEHRQRSKDGMWLYPVSLPGGGSSIMLKTLLSNSCVNDCRYCPFRADRDVPRCTLQTEEIAQVFMDYVRQRGIHGLFLSSGVIRSPDHTMERLNAVAESLRRRHGYRGYIHLKIIPGASPAAIEASLRVASAVSLNVEVPHRAACAQVSQSKDFDRDIVEPMRLISRLTSPGERYSRVRQTTQFIVGAAQESDRDIVKATFGLYHRLHLDRVYYSAYQAGSGHPSLPGEQTLLSDRSTLLTREHRLYQVDFLLRKYRWEESDIAFENDGSLSLALDPKQHWADRHPEFFPVKIRSADKEALLRVPGLGPQTVKRILEARRAGGLGDLPGLGLKGKRLAQVVKYIDPS